MKATDEFVAKGALSVIDAALELLEMERKHRLSGLRNARDVLAELVAAVDDVLTYEHVHDHQLERLKAARARLGEV